jgi:hypothetical protein
VEIAWCLFARLRGHYRKILGVVCVLDATVDKKSDGKVPEWNQTAVSPKSDQVF